MRTIITVLLVLVFTSAFPQQFRVGNKVEVYNSGGWYKATITETGSGNYLGYYYVHYDGFSQNQWIKASDIKLAEKTAATTANSPRNGRYIILSYGNPYNPVRLGYFDLQNGKYTYYNLGKKEIGSGNYSFDSNSKSVIWKNGPFKEAKWNGSFEIDREGKTHKIRLNSVTIGSNSTDSK